jgi:hypothetical protein
MSPGGERSQLAAAAGGLVPTSVECFGLRLDGGRLVGRPVNVRLDGDPDETAAAAIGLRGSPLDGTAVLHSTSWRWHPDAGIVLTYVCAPDPCTAADASAVVPAGGHPHDAVGPSRPGEAAPSTAHVLHHGIDHLAWLADHHPHIVGPSRAADPELWAAILEGGRHRAGRLAHHH